MRIVNYSAALAALALVLTAGAFAKSKDVGSFDLSDTARVGSTMLKPGHYTAEWTGSKDAVTISIVRDGKTVATAQGTLKDLPSKAPYASVSLKTMSDSSKRVDEIEFNNRAEALVFSGS